jgi:zinc protease
MSIFNRIVSAGGGNRIFKALRGGEEGLVYSAWGSFWPGMGASTYYVAAQTAADKTDRVLEIIHAQLEKAGSDITAKELKNAKRASVVGELIYKQTLSGQAQWAALSELYGMGYDFPKTYLDRIEKVTLEDLKRVAEKYLKNPFVLKLVPRKGGKGTEGD